MEDWPSPASAVKSTTETKTHSIDRPEETLPYIDASESEDSLTPEKLQVLISEYEERAVFEEREGCFGLAECFWKRAFIVSCKHFPHEKVTARIARNLGLFLNRFLPKSAQPVFYLRIAVDIYKRVNYSSTETLGVHLDFAQVLMQNDYCEEAEPLLSAIVIEAKETLSTLKATTYIGQIRHICGDYLRAEEILRANIEQIRVLIPDSEVLAEALCALGEILVGMERYSESRTVMEESLSIFKRNPDEQFFGVLRSLAKVVQKTGDEQAVNALFDPVLAELHHAHPYIIAEVLLIQGNASDSLVKLSCGLQALALYRSVRAKSWYVANACHQLFPSIAITGKEICDSLFDELDEQLSELVDSLPVSSIIMLLSLNINYARKTNDVYWKKVGEWIRRETKDELVCGEALLNFDKASGWDSFADFIEDEMSKFTQRFPNSRITAQIYASRNMNESRLRKSIELHEKLCMPLIFRLPVLIAFAECLVKNARSTFSALNSDSTRPDNH